MKVHCYFNYLGCNFWAQGRWIAHLKENELFLSNTLQLKPSAKTMTMDYITCFLDIVNLFSEEAPTFLLPGLWGSTCHGDMKPKFNKIMQRKVHTILFFLHGAGCFDYYSLSGYP